MILSVVYVTYSIIVVLVVVVIDLIKNAEIQCIFALLLFAIIL